MQNPFDIDFFTPDQCMIPMEIIEQNALMLEHRKEKLRQASYIPKDAFKIDYTRKL